VAFFSKLKERLFKSSSKIDEGLEAIVSEGGEAEAPETDRMLAEAPAAAVEELPQAAYSDDAPLPADPQEVRVADAAPGPEESPPEEPTPVPTPPEEPTPAPLPPEEPEPVPAPPEEPRPQPTPDRPVEPGNPPPPFPEHEPPRDPRPGDIPGPAETPQEVPQEQPTPSNQPLRDPEPSAPRDAPRLSETLTPVAPDLAEAPAEAAPRPGLLGRLMGRGSAQPVVRRTLDDEMLEQLEELLITADMGVDTALRVTANMAEGRFGKKLSVAEIKALMATEIARIMEPVARPLPIYAKRPQVVLVVGVNGSGKTTTIGKLASQFRAAGKKVVIAAGDTFRAAAVEQLQVWGDRAGVPVLTAAQGTDPASLAFDAMTKAEAEGADLLMIDTAGRLQNRQDLMEELAKIVRVIRKKDESAPHNTLLVLDATTGQNAVSQVKTFQAISDVSGLVMTKLDGTAKGGVLVALADQFGLPIHAIGVGEQIDDLSPFDPGEFAEALVGVAR
jgi:fused signal recognition particle receptor